MTLSDEKAVAAQIKTKGEEIQIRSPIFIYGSEEYLKQYYLRLLMENGKDAFSSFNDLRFDFTLIDMHLLADALSTPPFMASRKSILVYNIAPKDVSAEQMRQLEELLQDLPEDCRILFLEKSGSVDDKRDEKSKKLIKLFDKAGTVLCLKERTVVQLQKMVRADAEKQGCLMTSEAAKRLIMRVGRDMALLKNETAKLCAFRQNGDITPQDIDSLTVQQPEDNIYNLAKSILQNRYDEAMHCLSDLYYLRYPEESILGTLAQFFVDLYRARAAVKLSVDVAEMARDFGYGKRTFALENAVRDQKKLSDSYLSCALEILSQADIRLKSTSCNGRTLLEETVTALFIKDGWREHLS